LGSEIKTKGRKREIRKQNSNKKEKGEKRRINMKTTSHDISYKQVRPAAILTDAYVAGTVLENCEKYNSISLLIDFTKGSLTDTQIKIEVSADGTNYYQIHDDSITTGVNSPVALVYKFTADADCATLPITISSKYIKISSIGTGTITSSSLAITAVLSEI
jgi:Rps23 Pro-64 3,4-dihydroxylase Tpa1-like proline 4-hydroxylase